MVFIESITTHVKKGTQSMIINSDDGQAKPVFAPVSPFPGPQEHSSTDAEVEHVYEFDAETVEDAEASESEHQNADNAAARDAERAKPRDIGFDRQNAKRHLARQSRRRADDFPCMTTVASLTDWITRWVIVLTTLLFSLRMRTQIDIEMRAFARRMPKHHGVLEAGALQDFVVSLDAQDPFRNLYRDKTNIVRRPRGAVLGSWHYRADLTTACGEDVRRDLVLAPSAEPLSDSLVEFFFHSSRGWEDACDFLLGRGNQEAADEVQQNVFEVVENAIRWVLLWSQGCAFDGDEFFSVTALAWVDRTSRIAAGQRFDTAQILHLGSGASIPPGTEGELTDAREGDAALSPGEVCGEGEISEGKVKRYVRVSDGGGELARVRDRGGPEPAQLSRTLRRDRTAVETANPRKEGSPLGQALNIQSTTAFA